MTKASPKKTQTQNLRPIELEFYRHAAKVTLARYGFYDFCRAVDPEWYKDERPLLSEMCNLLENLYFGRLLKDDGEPYTKLMINIPPRHSKTRTLVHFCEWALGLNQHERIITASYNDDTAQDFSRFTRDGIQARKNDPYDIVYSDVFPNSRIKKGMASYEKWALEGEHFSYLGAGIGGSITGKGATIRIIDDPVKGAFEAYNINHLNKIWLWYTSTFMSRVEPGIEGLDIIVMTRWSKHDVCGKILDTEDADDWMVFVKEAYDADTDEMLEAGFLTKKRYESIRRYMDPMIFFANYHQKTIQQVGALYDEFEMYEDIPRDENGNPAFDRVDAYIDSADTGDDWHCSLVYGRYNDLIYILDVYFTPEKMEITEPGTAKQMKQWDVKVAKFESNGAGRGFARNVKRIMTTDLNHKSTVVKWFHQSLNKQTRIYTWSAWINQNVLMPKGWNYKWSKFYEAVTTYTKEAQRQNEHDDAPDALTGIAEEVNAKKQAKVFKRFI